MVGVPAFIPAGGARWIKSGLRIRRGGSVFPPERREYGDAQRVAASDTSTSSPALVQA